MSKNNLLRLIAFIFENYKRSVPQWVKLICIILIFIRAEGKVDYKLSQPMVNKFFHIIKKKYKYTFSEVKTIMKTL